MSFQVLIKTEDIYDGQCLSKTWTSKWNSCSRGMVNNKHEWS